MIPIDDRKWFNVEDYGDKTKMPAGHKIQYARLDDGTGIVVRITGPDAHVWGEGENGPLGLATAIDVALEWFNSVGREL